MKTKWSSFLNDMGDTIGGFMVGIGVCRGLVVTTSLGLILIVVSNAIKYYNKNSN